MNETEMRYDAFISYRHCEPDKDVAVAIQKKLENYRLPSEVASKLGKKQLTRVFRDESEFAVSADLSEAIMEALKQSEYLIVICTPRLKDSEWCRNEIETFLKLRDRKHILLVLAEGEPEEVFPDILLYEEVTRTDMSGHEVLIREEREPLAADCRGETKKERKHNMELSVIRLVASILGIGFDDLVQRHRRQRILRRNLITLAVFLVVAFIAAQALFFIHRISEQNRIISDKYADSMASTSERLLADGRRMDAIYAARSVLPDKKNGNINTNAFKALVDAEGLFESPLKFSCSNILTIPSSIFTVEVSADASLAGLLGYNSYRYIVDTATGEVIYSYEEESSGNGTMAFDGTSGIFLRRVSGPLVYRDFKTGEEKTIYDGEGRVYSLPGDSGVILVTRNEVCLYKEGSLVYSVDHKKLGKSTQEDFFALNLRFSPDGKHAVLHFCTLQTNDMILQFNVETGEGEAFLETGNTIDAVATDGNKIIYTCSKDEVSEVSCYDVAGKKIISEKEVYGPGYVQACINKGKVVIARDDIAVVYLPEKGSLSSFGLRSGSISAIPYEDSIILLDYEGGYNLCDEDYKGYYQLAGNGDIVYTNFVYKNDKFFLAGSGENYLTIYEKPGSEYCRGYNGENEQATDDFKKKICDMYGDMDATLIYSSGISSDGKYGYIQNWNQQVNIYELTDLSLKQTMYNCNGYCRSLYYEEDTGLYYLTMNSTYILDSELRHVMTINDAIAFARLDDSGELLVDDDEGNYFILKNITYEDVIKEADRRLDAYEPDEAAREKYGF